MVLPIPKKHTSHMGHNPPHSDPLPNSDLIPEDYTPGAEGNPEWWEYLDVDSEDDYRHEMRNLKRMREQDEMNLNIYYTDDDSSAFFGCSYDEILAMYEEGTVIPEEVLNWARSMAQNDVSSETVTVQSDDAEALYLSLKQNPDANLKTITQIFSDKCKEKSQELDAYGEELTTLLKDVDVMRNKIELLKEDAQKETEPLKDEWEDINYKLSHGIELTPQEKARAEYLKGKFGEIDENYKSQISSEIVNLGIYLDKISEVSQKIEIANSYSRVSKTILDELSSPEASNANAGIITSSDMETEETLNNDDVNANFTMTLYNAVYAMDNSVTFTNNKSTAIMSILEETAEIGGFQLNDPNHTIKTDFTEDIDFSILDNEDTPNSESDDIKGDDNSDEPDPTKGDPDDVIPEDVPPEKGGEPVTDGGKGDPVTGRGGDNPVTDEEDNPVTKEDDNNPVTGKGGYNPVTNRGNNNPVTSEEEINPVTEDNSNPTTGTGRGYTSSGTGTTGSTTEQPNNRKTKEETEEENVDVASTSSQTKDVKSQTKSSKLDASTSWNHKKASKENEKKVKTKLKALQKEEKKYNEKLDSLQKNIETLQQEVEEDESRISELRSRAESIQEQSGNEENEDDDKQKELSAISLEMAGMAAETKEKANAIDKTIKTQKTDRKKVMDTAKKTDKVFKGMQAIGKDYQGTNDNIQTTVDVFSTVASTATTVGGIVKKLGKKDVTAGNISIETGKPMLSNFATAAEGAALITKGALQVIAGNSKIATGINAEIAGMAGSAQATATDSAASNVRSSIDSFTDTSGDARSTGKTINTDVKKTQDDIKASNKDNAEIKKKIAEFDAQAMDVANMGGAGGLSQISGGGGTIGGTPAMAGASRIGGAGAVTGTKPSASGSDTGKNPSGANPVASPNPSVVNPTDATTNTTPAEGTNPTGTMPENNDIAGPDFGANPFGAPTGEVKGSENINGEDKLFAPGDKNSNSLFAPEEDKNGTKPAKDGSDKTRGSEPDSEFSDFEDLTIEYNMDDEEPSPEFAYNPEGTKEFGKPGSDYTPSRKPYIKAPEKTFNQSSNKGKKH